MLDLFLKLVDRIIQFQDRRSERKQVLFKEVVEPSFNEVSTVYSDYRKMLFNARKTVEEGRLDEAIKNLEADRELYLATRTKLAHMIEIRDAESYRDTSEPLTFTQLLTLYLLSIGWLINSRADQGVGSTASGSAAGRTASTLAEYLNGSRDDSEYGPIDYLDETLRGIEYQFREVAAYYGRLRAAVYLGDDLGDYV